MSSDPVAKVTFDINANDWPLSEPIVIRNSVATLHGQVNAEEQDDISLAKDTGFLRTLQLEKCYYGAADCPIYPFACELSPRDPQTARDILHAVKAQNFRSQHIVSLDQTHIRFPGYHPGTENDEIHNDFREQYVFSHEKELDELDGVHGALKRYVHEQRLWYVLVHTTPRPHGEFMFSEYVLLFVLGKSPNGNRCVGVVTHQVCHNLCD